MAFGQLQNRLSATLYHSSAPLDVALDPHVIYLPAVQEQEVRMVVVSHSYEQACEVRDSVLLAMDHNNQQSLYRYDSETQTHQITLAFPIQKPVDRF